MRKQRIPQPAPIVDQLREFFRTNRDESLSPKDIAAKYSVAMSTAYAAMRILENEGAIRYEMVAYVPRNTTL
jgi:ribosomal protein S25